MPPAYPNQTLIRLTHSSKHGAIGNPMLSRYGAVALSACVQGFPGLIPLPHSSPPYPSQLEPPPPLRPPAVVEVPPGPSTGPALGADAVGRLLNLGFIQWIGEAPVLLQGVDPDPPRPRLQVLAPGDRIGPESNRIEQRDVPQSSLCTASDFLDR